MASGQERVLRRRIKSIQSTKKITRAMELIAASRIVKAQQRVAAAHPEEATVERALGARGPAQVYVDHMQNARGKTLASVFSVRARPDATVSAPLSWRQLARPGFDLADYTVASVPRRLARLAARWTTQVTTTNPGASVRQAADAGGRRTR